MADHYTHLPHVWKYRPDCANYESFDFGFIDPTTCLDTQVVPHARPDGLPCPLGGRWVVWREYYVAGKTINAHIDNWKMRENPEGFSVLCGYADVNPGCTEEIGRLWCPVVSDPEAKKDFERAVSELQRLLQPVECFGPHLLFDPSCVNTIYEFKNYKYPKKRDPSENTNEGKPQNRDDHCIDPLRYQAMNLRVFGGGEHLSDLMGPDSVRRAGMPSDEREVDDEDLKPFFADSTFAGMRF